MIEKKGVFSVQGRRPIFLQSTRLSRSSVNSADDLYRASKELVSSGYSGPLDVSQPGTAHLVGIGGAGMRALANILADRGWELSGSDLNRSTFSISPNGNLRQKTIPIHQGHVAENLPREAECVVYSEAIPSENPEILAALERGLPVLTCYQMLGLLMADRYGIAIAGTHGKSTVTAMAAHVLIRAGKDPTVLCGATPLGDATGGRAGSGPFLSEACEYREHFLELPARMGVVLGIEPDHFDYFESGQHLESAFEQFTRKIPSDGQLLVRAGCDVSRRVAQAARCNVESFAVTASASLAAATCANWVARIVESERGLYTFDVLYRGKPLVQIRLPIPGEHNLLNTLAAFAISRHQGVEPNQIAESLETFPGLARRLETVGTCGGITLVDDYAHHPTEVAVSISTVRRMYPGRRLVCVFQPHQTSRTDALLDEFVLSLQNVNQLWVADIFRAREDLDQEPTVTAADLADRVRRHGIEVPAIHRLEEISRELTNRLECDDVLLTIGAGNVREVCNEFVSQYTKLHQKR
jgi:UDP-N-acetylmuramate--alanine ligase